MSDPSAVFAETVKKYIELHDEIAEIQKQIRDSKRKKDELGEIILNFMKKNEIDECAVRDGKLVRRESRSTEGIKKDHIVAELKTVVGELEASELLDKIMAKREVKTREALSRRKNKSS